MSVQADDEEHGLRRGFDNVDAMAADGGRGTSEGGVGMSPAVPPNYIKTYDDGRPRH